MSVPSPTVRTKSLSVGYVGKTAATVPDLDLAAGVVWQVTGPNGSGKTALLKTLAGLLPPISGRVERRRGSGRSGTIYVHSVPYLFAGTVRRNLTLVQPGAEDLATITDTFRLSSLLDRDASMLSHGQQRRLAIARALLGGPSVLLVDEPEGGLDDEGIAAWRATIARMANEGSTLLVLAAQRAIGINDVDVSEIRL